MNILQPGQQLGPYQIIHQIGKGGMATVYKAYQPSVDRYVAIKVLSYQFATDEEFLARFQQEARLIAKLEHAHILPIHDFGESDGIPYLVMRYLEAGTLKERIQAGPLELPEIDHIFTQLAEALEYAHENGVIHRDIKPANAMLDRRGEVFLTDFGIAKLVEGSVHTVTGAITGTPAYMSPEQAQGNRVDHRTDIYSLGIVLYEMISGRVPHDAETPLAIILKKIQEPITPLSTISPGVHPAIEAVILKALAKEPDDRYADMPSFIAGWKKAYTSVTAPAATPLHRPVSSMPKAAPPQPAQRPAAKTPTASNPIKKMALIGAGLGILLICFCLGAFLLRGRIISRRATGPAITKTPSGDISAVIPATPGWDSWAAANTRYALARRGDEIIAGGPGGVTIWDRNSGQLLRQITVRDGLLNPVITAVLVAKDNSLWFASEYGVAHLVESTWTYYTDEAGLDSTYVTGIAEVDGQIWVTTAYSGQPGGGLLRLEGERFQSLPGFPSTPDEQPGTISSNAYQILPDNEGRVWIGTDRGVAMLADDAWHIFGAEQGITNPTVYGLFLDRDGGTWLGLGEGRLMNYQPESGQFVETAQLQEYGIYNIYGLAQDNDGNDWVSGDHVTRYDAANDQWTAFDRSNGLPSETLYVALADPEQNRLYFATLGDGIVTWDGSSFGQWQVPNTPTYAEYRQILPAPDGKLWFVDTFQNGADLFDPASQTWQRPPEELRDGVPLGWDADGNLWLGGYGHVTRFETQNRTDLTPESGFPESNVQALAFTSDGTAWVGTSGGLVSIQDMQVGSQWLTDLGLEDFEIHALHTAQDGSLWVAVGRDIAHRKPDGAWEIFHPTELFGGYLDQVSGIAEAADGSLWFSTRGDGVYHFTNGNWDHLTYENTRQNLPSDYINAVTIAPDGSLWFASEVGAAHTDGQTWKMLTQADGLLSDNVLGIYAAPDGNVWFATVGGISRLRP